MNIRYQARKAFPILSALALMIAASASAQSFLTSPFAVDNAGEKGVPSVNPAVQTASVVFEIPIGYFYRVIVDTNGAGGVGSPDGIFDRNDDWTWQGIADVQLVPAQVGGQDSLAIRVDWDGTSQWDSNDLVGDGTYAVQVEIGFSDAAVRNGTGVKGQVQIEIDTKAPAVSFSADSFSPNADGQKDAAQLAFASSETLDSVEVSIAAGPVLNPPSAVFSAPYNKAGSASWDGTDITGASLPDGEYTLQIRGVDRAGNETATQRTIMIDTKKPAFSTFTPANGALLNAPLAQIEAALDALGGSPIDVDSLSIQVANAAGEPVEGALEIDPNGGGMRFVFASPLSTTAENGIYNVTASIADEAGNAASRASRFMLDTVAPFVGQAVASEGAVVPGFIGLASDTLTVVIDETGSGIDFGSAQATLTAPSGALFPVAVKLSETTGGGQIELTYANLTEEGVYTMQVSGARDLAGNAAAARSFAFIYDETPPRIESLTPFDLRPGALTRANSPFDSVVLTLSDNLTDIDFAASGIVVRGPNGAALSGTLYNDGESTVSFQLETPLSALGADDGQYDVSVRAADAAGNAVSIASSLILDTQAPRILSMTPAPNSVLSDSIEQIVLTLAPDATGLDISAVTATLLSPSGAAVPAALRIDSNESLRLEFAPLRADGTDDGTYRVVWNLVDLAGNSVSETREFTLSSRKPFLVSSEPADGAYVNRWSQFTAQLGDDSGAGINFDTLQISVSGPDGQLAAGRASHDGAQTVAFTADAPAPTNGSADGVYAVSIYVENKQGGASVIETAFTLDTAPPSLLSVSLAHGATLDISSPLIVSISVSDEGSGIDFDASTVQVIGPGDAVIPALVQYDGAGVFLLSTEPLTAFGRYRIETTLSDRAGNVSAPSQTVFEIQQAEGVVTSVQPAHRSYVRSLSSASVELSGATSDSTIELIGPDGQPVVGTASFDLGVLTLNLETPLASDGRDDGEYTLRVTPVDAADIPGPTLQYSFTMDTQAPRISGLQPANIFSAGGYVSAELIEASVQISDASSGVDLSASSIRVVNSAGADAQGVQTDDGAGGLMWRAEAPLPDGSYTLHVQAADRAGHTASMSRSFALDTQAPSVVSSSVAFNATVTEAITQIEMQLSDGGGSGVDLSASEIALNGPSGAVPLQKLLSGDALTLSFPPLNESGGYALSVRLSDEAGNMMSEAEMTPFTVTLDGPAVVSLTINGAPPSAYVSSLTEARAQFADRGGVGLDFTDGGSSLAVTGPNGAVDGFIQEEGSGLVWRPTGIIDADGSYTVSASAVDKRGRRSATLSHTFILDTQAPSVVSSSVGFDEELTSPINSVQLTLSDGRGVGVDLSASAISLSGPGGAIPLQKSFDGETLTLVFPEINENGGYTLSVQLSDEAGNRMSEAELTPFTVTLDGPAVVSLTINGAPPSAYVSSLTEARAQFADRGGVGLDFTDGGSSLAVTGPNGAVDGFIQEEGSGLVWRPTGIIDADGSYTVTAMAVDKRGRTSAALSHTFILDTQAPSVVSSSVGFDEELTSPINSVQLTLSDGEGVGVDLSASAISLSGPGGAIPLQKSFDGETLTLVFPEINENGGYTLSVQLSDEAGNRMSEAELTPFTVTLDGPAVVSLTINGAPPSAYVSSLTEARAQFADRGGVGLDFTDGGSSLAVTGPNGAVDGFIQEEGSGLVWRPTGIIDADGSYTVTAMAVDKRGRTSAALSHTFILDTQAPSVVSSSVGFDEELTSPINSVQLTLSDGEGVGVDLSASAISLSGPGGAIPLQKSFDGETLTLVFPEISENGDYTLSVRLSDEAGNMMSEAELTPFTATLDGPAVVSLTINGAPPSAYVSSLTEARAQFADRGEVGLDFTDGGSSLAVTGPNGAVDGFIQEEGSSLVWRPIGVMDADGSYTVSASAVDKRGRRSATLSHTFILDTQAPRILSMTPEPNSILSGGIEQIVLSLAPDATGLDISATTATLLSPDGSVAPSSLRVDSNESLRLEFAPLRADGTDDGTYRVVWNLVDRAGNSVSETREFTLANRKPFLVSSEPADGAYVNRWSQFTAQLGDDSGAGINFDTLQISISGPDGQLAAGRASHDGAQTVAFTADAPAPTNGSADGVYAVSIYVENKLGVASVIETAFTLDTTPPSLLSVSLAHGAVLDVSLPLIVSISVKDEGSGIDFDASTVQAIGPDGAAIPALVQYDGSGVFYLSTEPLTAYGQYRIETTLSDRAGNVSVPSQTVFKIHLAEKIVANVQPAHRSYVRSLSSVSAELSGATSDSTIELIGPNGEPVVGSDFFAFDVLTLNLETPLASDGRDDGEYTLRITPVYAEGVAGPTLQYSFTMDTQAPRISGLQPANVFSAGGYVSAEFMEASVQISDASSGVDLSVSSIRVFNSEGKYVRGVQTDDGAGGLVWTAPSPLPDGSYTLHVNAADRAGHTASMRRSFALDTQAPSVVASSIGFDEELTSPINSVQLTLSDGEGAGVDLSASAISLSGPGGAIPLQKSFDGETLTLVFPEINENGGYTLSVQLSDEAGNMMSEAELTPFTVTLDGPAVVSLTINGAPPSAYVSSLTEARAQFADRGGVGLDFTDGGTSLVVTGPNGPVDGLTLEEGSSLVWRPATAAVPDGSYTVTATAVDKRGRTSAALSHTFILDTQAPSVVASSVGFDEELTSPINSVQLTLSDGEGVGVDLSASAISLSGPGGAIPLQKSFDGETLTLVFPEINENGGYTLSVQLSDEAGNMMSEAELTPFTMTLDGPVVVSVTVNGAAPSPYATSLTEAGAVFADRSGAGLDFTDGATRIQVTGPRGEVNGTLAQNGDALTWTPDVPIRENGTDDGTYTVSASAVDLAGQSSPTESYAFILDTQVPRITSALPLELLTSLGYMNSPPSVISVTLADAASGVDLSASSIAVFDSGGTEVTGVRTDDGSGTIIWTAADPFADDGSSDGVYIAQLTAADRAGHILTLARPFTLDTQHPTVASSSVAFDAELTAPINSIQLTLTDGEGVGVDMSASSFALSGPGGSIPLQKTTDGDSVELVFPVLKTNGVYTLSTVLADKAGNVMPEAALTPFTVRLSGPSVVGLSVNGAAPTPYASSLTEARAEFEDRGGVGLDFTDAGSSLRVTGPRGGVSGVLTADGDALVWTPAIPLRTDGSDDGTYTVSASAVDMGGRASSALTHTFILDTQAPRVVSSSPVDASMPTSYMSASFSALDATVADMGPAGLEAGRQSIRLIAPGGGEVPAEASHTLAPNGEGIMRLQLDAPLPTNGSGDGVYTLEIEAVDRAGNALSMRSAVVYDTQPPALTASTPADGAVIDPTARQITLQIRDSVSGVDPAAAALTLTSPSGAQIPGTTGVSIDGENSTVQFSFEKILTEVGDYVLAAELVDRAGNRRLIELRFYNASNTPTVIQTVPDTRLAETAYAEIGLSEVSALLREAPGSGISTAPGVSTIRLIDPLGNPVSGVQSSRGGNTLVLTLGRALRDDGSDDGTYQIEVTPANAAGIQGPTQTFTFVYDSQPPEIFSSIGTYFPQSEFEQSGDAIAGFYVDVLDDTSGVDWENVDETWMSLENPDGETVDATVRGNSLFQLLEIIFTTPLASDGSEDGVYTLNIRALDKAGNEAAVSFQFLVDLTAPVIDAGSLTVNGLTIVTDANETGYPTSVNSETGVEIAVNVTDESAGVDLARSGIVVTAPDGSQVDGTLRQNNLDRLVFESGPLTSEGVYSVSVTAVGIDFSGLGVQPESVLGASFLYEKSAPTAVVTSSPGNAVFESEPAHLTGTALDEPQQRGEGNPPVPASGVALVEIGGVGPDGEELNWEEAEDESPDAQNPWSQWSSDFLPSRSGIYRVLVRVTDRAGNSAVVDAGMYEFTTALAFKGPVYVWPNPLSRSRGDTAHFSFETNQADRAEWRLSVYTVDGALVYGASGQAERERQANSQSATWNLRNAAGQAVASGIYVFKLEIDDGQSVFRKMGRLLVVK